jgi:hypothetical protein
VRYRNSIVSLCFLCLSLSACESDSSKAVLSNTATVSSPPRHQHIARREPPVFFETAGGEIAIRQSPEYGNHSLWWRGQMLLEDDHLQIVQTYPENHGEPAILIVNRNGGGSIDGDGYLYVVDTGTTPPYIAPNALPIAVDYTIAMKKMGRQGKHHQLRTVGLTIKKIDDNTYSFSGRKLDVNAHPLSGQFFKLNNQDRNGKNVTFIYSRLKKTIEEKQ